MNKFTVLLFISIFSGGSMSKGIDCEISSEAASSITLEEFYFGYHIEVINIYKGPTVSMWGVDKENPTPKDGPKTIYLISVGYGDIAERPLVFRIKSSKNIAFNLKPAESISFDNGYLKIALMDTEVGLVCNDFALNIGSEFFK